MTKKLLLVVITFLMSVNQALSEDATVQENKKNILYDKPIFLLKIKSRLNGFHAVVNGVIVHKDFSGLEFSTQIPITQWFRAGENTLEIHSVPKLDNDKPVDLARLEVSLWVQSGSHKDERYKIAQLAHSVEGNTLELPGLGSTPPVRLHSEYSFFPDDEGDVVIHPFQTTRLKGSPGAYRIVMDVDVPSNLPRWSFFDADHIGFVNDLNDEDRRTIKQQLAPTYRSIQRAIVSGNIDDVMHLFEERNAEYDKAFYLPSGSYREKLRQSFQNAAEDTDLEPLPLDDKYLRAHSPYGGQIVRLERASGRPAIVFNIKQGGSMSYDIWFRRKNGQWIITR